MRTIKFLCEHCDNGFELTFDQTHCYNSPDERHIQVFIMCPYCGKEKTLRLS